MTDAIEASTPRLEQHEVDRLSTVKTMWVAGPLGDVLHLLDEKYLHG
jgi:hypothetical protein